MGSHAFEAAAGAEGGSPTVPLFVPSWVDEPVLRLQGRVEGPALADLGALLEAAVTDSTGQVTIDLSDVDGWSLLAQAMVLNTARALAARRRRLVLVGPSPALREQSRRLQVFERVAAPPAR